ncbi:hypothetical protein ACCO45_004879 [Purpureocillium lilacinum]|uniref:Uncharacterized protein n=1 Tax=Purpureocillium lilacinum TaxID=33203 RepID=A0ACC4DV17_PURLI
MLSIRLFVITAFGLVVAVAAQLSSQCQFVRFSPGFDSEDPISYTARCARVPDGPVEVCSELRLGHCFTNQDGSLGGAVEYADDRQRGELHQLLSELQRRFEWEDHVLRMREDEQIIRLHVRQSCSQATTSPFTTASWPAQQRARVRYPNAPFPGWEARLGAADLSGDRSQGRDLVAIY